MGASTFYARAQGKSAKEAFKSAVDEARHERGHGGYTGSIAEKRSFIMITLPAGEKPYEYANKLIDKGDSRIDDKSDPAGCFDLGNGEYAFFGWASS